MAFDRTETQEKEPRSLWDPLRGPEQNDPTLAETCACQEGAAFSSAQEGHRRLAEAWMEKSRRGRVTDLENAPIAPEGWSTEALTAPC